MKTASAKAKGRAAQKWVRDTILKHFPSLQPDDVRSTSMGASGEDILLSPAGRKAVPISIECKNVEKLNVWAAYEQAVANGGDYLPVLFIKKNRKDPLAVLDAETFIMILSKLEGVRLGKEK